MKQNLHPKSNKDVKVTCACGNIIETMSTLGKDFKRSMRTLISNLIAKKQQNSIYWGS